MQQVHRIGLIGCGLRGVWYLHSFRESGMSFELAAVADTDPHYAGLASKLFADGSARVFSTGEAMIEAMPDLDGVIIASPNHVHREPAVRAMRAGMNLLLEKPVAASLDDMAAMWHTQQASSQNPIIGFCMRYTPFYRKVKEICDSGALGQILVINAEELMSDDLSLVFARGDWRPKQAMSGGLLSEKCSHDMDLINWFAGSHAKLVHSFAQRTFLTPRPEAGTNCRSCKLNTTCRFSHGSLPEIYETHWPEKLHEVLQKLQDDTCVFSPQHTYPDHQILNIQYANGVLANFTLAQCQPATRRTIHIIGSEARLYGVINDKELRVFRHSRLGEETVEVVRVNPDASGHNGGDSVLTRDFFALMQGQPTVGRPGLREGIEASIVTFAADQSAAIGRSVNVDTLRNRVFAAPAVSAEVHAASPAVPTAV